MINGIYLALPKVSEHSGVKKKIEAQIATLRNSDIHLSYVEIECKKNYNSNFSKALHRLPFVSTLPPIQMDIFNEAKVLYFRYYLGDLGLIRFLRKLREMNNDIIILFEFVDWPYERHYCNFKDILLLLKDLLVRRFYKKYIDRAVVFTNNKKILGVRTIRAQNGIIVSDERKKKVHYCQSINLLCVSTMQYYHGYDRLIKGLGQYYKQNEKRKILLHFVGNGPELSGYKDLVLKLRIEDNVIFYGEKRGKELDEIYDMADIAVSSLGLHRIGMMLGTSLKTSEYLAKGLPIVISGKVNIFDSSIFPYSCEFPPNNFPIDFVKLVNFYDTIYNKSESRENVVDDVRNWAYKICDMSVSMENIVNYILEEAINRENCKMEHYIMS